MNSLEKINSNKTIEINRFEKIIFFWFFGGTVLVFLMIVLGGVTRITDSGLSMVDWRLFMGIIPPLNNEQWLNLFSEYKKYPEYQMINFGMTLVEFKLIYWFEYSHRILGRFLGLFFIIPFIFFIYKKAISIKKFLLIIFLIFLGGCQGFLGWYMVKSGLQDNPDVSQYRLASHYSLALLIYIILFWNTLSNMKVFKRPNKEVFKLDLYFLMFIPWLFFVMVSGVFVAGTDAGLLYNTYPLMNNEFFPYGFFDMSPKVLNFFENKITINFFHRVLTFITILFVFLIWIRKLFIFKKDTLYRHHFFLLCVIFQFVIGIILVKYSIPTNYAIFHHIGALILISSALYSFYGEVYEIRK